MVCNSDFAARNGANRVAVVAYQWRIIGMAVLAPARCLDRPAGPGDAAGLLVNARTVKQKTPLALGWIWGVDSLALANSESTVEGSAMA